MNLPQVYETRAPKSCASFAGSDKLGLICCPVESSESNSLLHLSGESNLIERSYVSGPFLGLGFGLDGVGFSIIVA